MLVLLTRFSLRAITQQHMRPQVSLSNTLWGSTDIRVELSARLSALDGDVTILTYLGAAGKRKLTEQHGDSTSRHLSWRPYIPRSQPFTRPWLLPDLM